MTRGVQVFVEKTLIYDSRLQEYMSLSALSGTLELNKAGAFTIRMPCLNDFCNLFILGKSIVTIYRYGEMIFKGRPLQQALTIDGMCEITLEGERAYLRDSIMRPYKFDGKPSDIFTEIINSHNNQVDESRQFDIGDTPIEMDGITFEKDAAETTNATIDALVSRCGGYVTFGDSDAGKRKINWLPEFTETSGQAITHGQNLISMTVTAKADALATAIIPYGAKDSDTGERLTIASINNGIDYIQDDAAVTTYGFIATTKTWDDITDAENLFTAAETHLKSLTSPAKSVDASAIDLSYIDNWAYPLRLGENVRVVSPLQNVNEAHLVVRRTYDLLNPKNDKVILGSIPTTITSN